ncbi:transporter substrate-binding domain-containing protein [Pseudomonas sp. JS3066]|uniref:substrate-binding periplasmic protein n=1 Tax=Pseudomonas sp. JS3066 TaxID=3090665 RepID=UPI002E7B8AC0|nr:transporter substrate-binding domain-containing protein [Pseudomonas sp. JS3066]WVK93438.1 transporter substrate-binding domain-containing protein [Pseudomonas sp. JS3066]
MPVLRIVLLTLLACLGSAALAEPLRIVSEPWAPYIFEEEGQLRGLDYEASAIVFQRMGIEVQWSLMPWKRCLMELENGQADAVLDIFRNQERESQMVFPAEPLSEVEFVLFYARQRPYPFQRLADLRGLKIGVSPGYWYADQAFRTSPLFTREPAPTHEANLGKLVRDRVDLVVNDRRAGLYLVHQMGLETQIASHPRAISRDRLYLAFRRQSQLESLAAPFGETLRRFKQEPAYAQLVARYREPGQEISSNR